MSLALMFLLASVGGVDRDGNDLGALDGFFWMLLWIPLVFVMPARSLMAVTEEKKAQTLELVQMTRMQSLRIVLGKWLALNVQSVLLVVAILPYLVLRYFFGGVDLMSNAGTLGSLAAFSLVLTAAGLAASTLNVGVRIVMTVGTVMALMVGAQIMAFMSIGGMGGAGMPSWPTTWWAELLATVTVVAGYVGFFLLQAAGELSTQTESYSGWKRGWALGCLLVVVIGVLLTEAGVAELNVVLALIPVAVWTLVEAICDKTDVDWETAEGGNHAWWKSWITHPGWASGFVFAAVVVVGTVVVTMMVDSRPPDLVAMVYVILFAAALTPALLLLPLPKVKQRVLCYWLFQLAFGLLFSAAMMATVRPSVREEDALMWLTPFPPSIGLGMFQQEFDEDFIRDIFPISGAASVAVIVIFAVLAMRHSRRMKAERVA